GCGGDALLHVTVKLGPRRGAGVASIDKARIRDQASDEIVDHLIAVDDIRQALTRAGVARPNGELAFELPFKRNAIRVRPFEVAPYLRRVHSRIQIGEVPFRQRTKPGTRFSESCTLEFGGSLLNEG